VLEGEAAPARVRGGRHGQPVDRFEPGNGW